MKRKGYYTLPLHFHLTTNKREDNDMWNTNDVAQNRDRPIYDEDGYDENGYDCDGYDCGGFNEDGYDANGYDCDGYDCDGYDRDGFNEDGYNIHGDHIDDCCDEEVTPGEVAIGGPWNSATPTTSWDARTAQNWSIPVTVQNWEVPIVTAPEFIPINISRLINCAMTSQPSVDVGAKPTTKVTNPSDLPDDLFFL
jgi:hypothetical protein